MNHRAVLMGGPNHGQKIYVHDKLPNIYIPEPVDVVPCDHPSIVHAYRLVKKISGDFLIYKWMGCSR